MQINEKALLEAFRSVHHPDAEPSSVEIIKLTTQIRAYLEAATPPDVAGLVEDLDSFQRAYPEEVFPELTDAERMGITSIYPGLIDRISASMGRHFATFAGQAATALRLSAGGGWRPIDGAPKDGTEFIAFEDGDVYRCKWYEEEPDEGPGHVGWWDFVNGSFENPTRWMPLPPASPTVEAGR